MIERIVVGIIIGFASGFFLSKGDDGDDSSGIVLIFTAIISIAFIGSSFMFGAGYGLMAIGEIVLGFFIASSIFKKKD